MSELLETAEHFYACARHVRHHIAQLEHHAEFMERTADMLSEQNMKLQPMPSATSSSTEGPAK